MTLQDLNTTAQYAVAAGYSDAPNHTVEIDSTRSLDFRVSVRSAADLQACLRLIRAYNRFDGEHVYNALEDAFDLGDLEGYAGLEVAIGRESSPVLYVSKRGADRDRFADKCMALARRTEADQCAPVDGHTPTFRLWWD